MIAKIDGALIKIEEGIKYIWLTCTDCHKDYWFEIDNRFCPKGHYYSPTLWGS